MLCDERQLHREMRGRLVTTNFNTLKANTRVSGPVLGLGRHRVYPARVGRSQGVRCSIPNFLPRNINTFYRTVRSKTFPFQIDVLFKMTMFVAQRGISKITPSRFWIDKDLVYRQSVLQRKLVFPGSKNIWMLPRHEKLNCYKYSRNN